MGWHPSDQLSFNRNPLTQIVSDTMFLVPSQLEATQKAALGWPVYLYMIDHVYRHSYPPEVPVEGTVQIDQYLEKNIFIGAYHAVELPALYDIRFFPFAIKQSDAEDSAFEKLLLRSITNFVRTGLVKLGGGEGMATVYRPWVISAIMICDIHLRVTMPI